MIYFAFGSNMDPEQMKGRCPSHKVLGRAYLSGHDLCFPRRSPRRNCGTAGLVRAEGKGVWGVLYALEERDAVNLHEAEGYAPGRPLETNRHDLVEIEVRRGGPEGEAVRAYIYLARPDGSGAEPSPDYMAHLIRGAEYHRLPETYLRKLQSLRGD